MKFQPQCVKCGEKFPQLLSVSHDYLYVKCLSCRVQYFVAVPLSTSEAA
jgi:DNA-directed RNA polymerase subunit RPC12/RpoP